MVHKYKYVYIYIYKYIYIKLFIILFILFNMNKIEKLATVISAAQDELSA